MSIPEMKEVVLKQLADADDRLLRMVYAMIEAYQEGEVEDPVVSYDVHGRPRRASELAELLEREVKRGKAGEYLSVDALDEKSKG